ncbi:MAG: CHASE2 domain-containing protein, partial [Chitinivibrionales bacterium]|nr:CHASE2 domain-containing protein [Chitinivibrionales bacterium]MBD3395980.1 CHASE2 domain-containing protein [Chitinivibrionales bacterium]
EGVADGEEKLVFHTFMVKNKDGVLLSSIPVLREQTLRELCATEWGDIEAIEPGTRRDFGKTVRIPLTPNNQHIVTYFGPKDRPFKYYSYYDIMKDRIHGSLEGKIFLVGSTVPNMFDIVAVPLSNVYPGVEVHASLMHSFLSNTFVKALTAWQEFFILLLVGVIIGFISYMLKPLPGAILTFVAVFGYFLLAMTVFGTQNLWIPIARPTLTLVLTFTGVMAYRYVTEEKDRKFLQSTFKQYLSPELIDMMYKNKQMPQLGGEEGIRTAYFTDIQSFSTFSEKLGSPTRLVELLNEYLSAMTDILLSRFGTLDKYEGDAIIAFFGAPMPMEDHAQQACATALDMQRRLGELRKKWMAEGEKWPAIVHNMRMRIGINTGAITTGNMGSNVRMNYTMMGDAVNLAARLEAAAKQYGVYTMISHFTRDIVKDSFELRQLDKITVVGKSEPVVVYELIGEKGSADEQTKKLLEQYGEGLARFYDRQWDRAAEILAEAEKLEPYRDIAPKGMSPSKRIISYCTTFKENPPPPEWDGVVELTSK